MSKVNLQDVVEAISGLSKEEIDKQIAEIDQKIAEATRPLQAQRETLVTIRRILIGRELGTKGRAARAKKRAETPADTSSPTAKPGAAMPLADELRIYLQAAGPSKVTVIADQIGREYQTVYGCLNTRKDLFRKTGEGQFGLK